MAFACYLDEARSNKESPYITMAGYIAPYTDWLPFEQGAGEVCAAFGVSVIHGFELEAGRGEYKGWDRFRKRGFVQALQDRLKPTGAFGVGRRYTSHTLDQGVVCRGPMP